MIGTVLALRYELRQELDSTPLYKSYSALDRQSGKEVRLRVVDPSFTVEPAFVRALRAHVEKIQSVSSPGIERVYGFYDDDGQVFLVSDLFEGVSLDERIKRLSTFSIQLAVATGISIAEALATVHQAGLIHGDVSGRNVVISPAGQTKLCMVGFWEAYPSSTRAGLAMLRGMAPYLAPEITAGAMPSVSSEVYALGVLLYRMLSGRYPYPGDSTAAVATKHATAPYPSLRSVNPSVPQALDELIAKCLAKSPHDRYTTVSAVLTDLRHIQDALRFGRPLTWPIGSDAPEPSPVAPAIEEPIPTSSKKQKEKRTRRPVAQSDGVPVWIAAMVYVTTALALLAVGGWVFFNLQKPKLIDLPNIVAMSQADAQATLDKLGLKMSVQSYQASEKYPAGTVMEQTPLPGSRKVREHSFVQVVLSAGGRFVEVPDLRGRNQEEAVRLLEALNLKLSDEVAMVRDDKLAAGLIVSQTPEPRKRVERGTSIKVKVSNGNQAPADDDRANRFKYTLSVTMPQGAVPVQVRVDMTDEQETRTIHEEQHDPESTFTIESEGSGREAMFRVFFDGELVRQIVKQADGAGQ
ncbi:MAG: PASTA domain-containing protein [Fimbriimonadaceae bacterium]|nr:PASTA domain-containing protein [Fimbriimonadaceae bacterium]